MQYHLKISGEIRLTDLLGQHNILLDGKCGGRGQCRGCRVKIISGTYLSDGKICSGPQTVKACQTLMLEGDCVIECDPLDTRCSADPRIDIGPLPEISHPVIALDLGSTTICGVKICNGQAGRIVSTVNRQKSLGDNVLSRISRVIDNPDDLFILQKQLLDSIQCVLDQLDPTGVQTIAAAGNTVISHLLHGFDPRSMGHSPFSPLHLTFPIRQTTEFGLTAPEAEILTAPAASGFIGGDIISALGEITLRENEMLLDIGTNCEIVFNASGQLISASAAAGPAFEGAGIACGMAAAPGAVDHLFDDGSYSVIGGVAPLGICGSALVDTLAIWRRNGLIDRYGRFTSQTGQQEIAPGVFLSEAEIAELLCAKSAVSAGIKTLCELSGVPVKKIYLAGNFASYLDLKNAVAIGLLPDVEINAAGNTSLLGAVHLAVSGKDHLNKLEKIGQNIRNIELGNNRTFTRFFANDMTLE